ncbi:MAG: hydroxymethylpyrimidine/phosphomethylpyrimidine kinase [Crocinitomicaceae bacterium]|nr:hydroxymethylpyrimidine/phosphomethylpyrimidine kinase [Crocinitomicaceae bacterium]
MNRRPNILTIAGFDPSSGAGLTADVKTIENLRCYGFAVCSANTVQNDRELKACHWTPLEVMQAQINLLFKTEKIEFVKIGIVESWEVLNIIVDQLIQLSPKVKIILDPVLKSSSNFQFHVSNNEALDQLLERIFMITPNYQEIQLLYPELDVERTIVRIRERTNLFLKGGHREESIGRDELFLQDGKQFVFNPKAKGISEKHGSGCVLSSAITAFLAREFPLMKACHKGKHYTEQFLKSNKSLLGYHK